MKKAILQLLSCIFFAIPVLANQSPTAYQIAPSCAPWSKNLNCTLTNQQLVDNFIDQINTITSSPVQCNAGYFPLGIDTSGNVKNCTLAYTGAAIWGDITGTLSNQSDLQTALNGKQATGNYITGLTGDVAASGPGSVAATLATVNSSPGSYTNANITVNGKGLVTAAANGTSGTSQWTTTNTNDVYLPNNGNVGLGTTITTGGALLVMNGNVGIGTLSPGQLLDVNGTVRAPSFITSTNTVDSYNTAMAGGILFNYYLTGSGNTTTTGNKNECIFSGACNGLTSANDNLMIGNLAGEKNSTGSANTIIGEGAVAPFSGSSFSDSIAIGFNAGAISSFGSNEIVVGANQNGNGAGTTTIGNSSTTATIFPYGNLGIGSTNPGDALDVQGTIRGLDFSGIQASDIPTLNQNTTGNAATATALASNPTVCSAGQGTTGIIASGAAQGCTTYIQTLSPITLASPNVGIGSVTPGQALDVNGTVIDLGEIVNGNVGIGTSFINGTGEAAVTIMNGNVGIGTWKPIGLFQTNGSGQDVYINTFGNVGIGTAVPGKNLDVQGTVRTVNLTLTSATASTVAGWDANKNLITLATATYPSLTELSYVKGASSGIQNQINTANSNISTISSDLANYLPLSGGTMTGTTQFGNSGSSYYLESNFLTGTDNAPYIFYTLGNGNVTIGDNYLYWNGVDFAINQTGYSVLPGQIESGSNLLNDGSGNMQVGQNLTIGGTFTRPNCSAGVNHAKCYATGEVEGYCTGVVGATGLCSCTAC